jgi:inner membrane protein
LTSDLLNALLMGYLSHLFGDSFAHKGIPPLWPYKRAFCMPLTFRNGSVLEKPFVVGATCAAGPTFYFRHPAMQRSNRWRICEPFLS